MKFEHTAAGNPTCQNGHMWCLQPVKDFFNPSWIIGYRLRCAECGEVRRDGTDRGHESLSESRQAIITKERSNASI